MKIEHAPIALAAIASALALALEPTGTSLLRIGWMWGVASLGVFWMSRTGVKAK